MARQTTRTRRAAPDAVLLAAAGAAASRQAGPSEDGLATIRKEGARARDLAQQIENAEARVRELKAELNAILMDGGTLPALFDKYGVEGSITVKAEGNLPAYEFELAPFYSASLPKDPEKRAAAFKAFDWLRELTKHEFKVPFGKGQEKAAKKFAALLKENKIRDFSSKVDVLSQTLTAEVRRRFESGDPLAPADLEKLGAYVGKIVKINKRED